ncbi:outer membrane beta-barrel protein [Novosphingobium sp. YJ-S2-02]|uniref:Outer membrane beta-barrel protein n=1 Tax=Novosphingobium aureum TaxID=2792964 RepID=A0A931HDS8_9SPHN|nr:outer membrane beta-barrel protein [Novosphingobium aureum]MBH0113957.1 outer membrane beta-barrel protein [Novosphingobium aureum]
MACLVVGSLPVPAFAQNTFGPFLDSAIPMDNDRGRQVSVLDRPRPEYEPDGIPLAGFTLLPSVQAGIGASNNVFGAGSGAGSGAGIGKTGDAYFTLAPAVRLRSNWSRHALTLQGGGSLRRFTENPVRDETGLDAALDARLDLAREFTIDLTAGAERAYQSQYASDAPSANLSPLRYSALRGLVRGAYATAPIRLTAAFDINRIDFRDVTNLDGDTTDQDYRDRTLARGSVRIEYAFTPEFSAFGEASVSRIDHDEDLVADRPNRDGTDLHLLAGTSFDLAGIARAHVGLGMVQRTFRAKDSYAKMQGLGYDLRAEFFPSGLTTLTIGAKRTIREAATVGASGFFTQSLLGRVDHELMRHVLLFAQAQYQRSNFKGLNRRDTTFAGQAGALYLVNRTIRVTGALTYSDRASSGSQPGPAFDELRGVIAVTAAF